LFVLAAGGTGGHVFPAEALASALRARGARPVLFTDRRGGTFGGALADIEVCRIHAGKIAGLGIVARLLSVLELAAGFAQAFVRLRRLAPKAVVGFGGYASVPTLLAATVSGCRTVLHEQNAVLGRANRLLAKRVDCIATSFAQMSLLPALAAGAQVIRTGMPTRPAFARQRQHTYRPPDANEPIRLLILGGSQGARVFSEVIPEAVALLDPPLRQRLAISQQCRPETLDAVIAAYARLQVAADCAAFFEDVPERLAAAHLVIARSGASTVAEITAVGRPAILVPYPFATDDHQAANARALAQTGAAEVMDQQALNAGALASRLTELVTAPQRLAGIADRARAEGLPEASERLADLVIAERSAGAAVAGGGTP
jgi:UDP-N-acetylglucosamine--N-acetylmuramyl-(pentapeptide) pyrophosphoryl-undecaprenol N-acetylglucosamine transferase